jgi:DNA processing protein
MKQSTYDLLALTLVPGLGSARLRALLAEAREPGELLSAPRSQLRALRLTTEEQYYLVGGYARRDAEGIRAAAERLGVSILSPYEEEYPTTLRQIWDPPHILYVRGDLAALNEVAVAVVGSRRCSVYGREVAFAFSRDLARLGLSIVSGMALGIDSQAHLGALEGGGKTVAVLGSGVDVIYPRSHRRLYERIVEHGCVVSEFRPGTYAAAQNFPIRNRIISGLSVGTLIPEASEFSGSLITARLTLEQNRELWAVPGNVTNAGSYGPNHLIRQGARPVTCAQDVLEDLPLPVLSRLSANCRDGEVLAPAVGRERQVLECLSSERATHFDQILVETGLNVTDLSSVLVSLEASGKVRAYPGRRYSRVLEESPAGAASHRNRL